MNSWSIKIADGAYQICLSQFCKEKRHFIFLFSVQNWFLEMIFASKFVKLTEQIFFLK